MTPEITNFLIMVVQLACGALLWFIKRTLDQNDKTMKALQESAQKLSVDVARLEERIAYLSRERS